MVSIIVGSSICIFISIACAIIGFILRIHFSRQEAKKERQRIQALIEESHARRRKEEQEREEEIWNFKNANGDCDRLIIHKNFRLELYNKSQKVIFNGVLYSFGDILSCDIEKRGKIETASVIVHNIKKRYLELNLCIILLSRYFRFLSKNVFSFVSLFNSGFITQKFCLFWLCMLILLILSCSF